MAYHYRIEQDEDIWSVAERLRCNHWMLMSRGERYYRRRVFCVWCDNGFHDSWQTAICTNCIQTTTTGHVMKYDILTDSLNATHWGMLLGRASWQFALNWQLLTGIFWPCTRPYWRIKRMYDALFGMHRAHNYYQSYILINPHQNPTSNSMISARKRFLSNKMKKSSAIPPLRYTSQHRSVTFGN